MLYKYGMTRNKERAISSIRLWSIADISSFIRQHIQQGNRALVLVKG